MSKTPVSTDLEQLRAAVDHAPIFTQAAIQAIAQRDATRLFLRQVLTLMAVCGVLIAIIGLLSWGMAALGDYFDTSAPPAPSNSLLSVSLLIPHAERVSPVDPILTLSSVISLLARSVFVVSRLLILYAALLGLAFLKWPITPHTTSEVHA